MMRVQCRGQLLGPRIAFRSVRRHTRRARSKRVALCRVSVRANGTDRPSDQHSDGRKQSNRIERILKLGKKQWQLSSVMTGLTLTTLAGYGGDDGGQNGSGDGGGGDGSGGQGGEFNSQLNPLFEVAEDDDDEEEYTDEEYEEEVEGEDEAPGARPVGPEDEEEDEEDDGESDGGSEDEEAGVNDDLTRRDDLATNEFFVDEIQTEGLPEGGEGVPTKEELFAACRTQPGFVCTKADLSFDARNFRYSGVFQDIQVRTVEKDGKTIVVFKFIGMDAPAPKTLSVSSHKASQKLTLPSSQIEKAKQLILTDDGRFDAKKMFQLKHCLEEWYRKQGYSYCYVTQVDGMETGNLKVKLLEGRVGKVSITQVNSEGKPTGKIGNIPEHVILREIPFAGNDIYHQDMPQKCLREVFGLGLHETMSVGCKQSMKDETKFDIELQVKERPAKTADIELEWPIAPTAKGRPGLATLVPGGSLTWENGNLLGKGRLLSASATTANFLNPSEDLGYQLTYRHPDLKGLDDPKRTEFNATVFNTRNASAVFSPGAGKESESIVGVVVDRVGAKLAVSEQLARNSKFTYGAVLEQVANMDDSGQLMPAGAKGLPSGELDQNGPPTCLGGTGKDRLAFLQANLIRDTSYFLHGTQLGNRQIFQVEQGVGLGSDKPLFNRLRATATHFHQIGQPVPGEAPKSLVIHGKGGACIGDQPPYELFTLGGPFSVRGYQVGEVAATRAFLEGALELRWPWRGRRLYTFAEGASDLGTSKLVLGNPTQYFDKPGSAFSLGAGVKLGAARLECATEGISKPSVFNVRFGERF